MTHIIKIPFSGFYHSFHSMEIEEQIEQNELDWEKIDYEHVHQEYAKEYTEYFAQEFEIDLQFESLHSPKFHNFQTDRIFAHISMDEIKRIYSLVDKDDFEEVAKECFTSCSGFISFYSPNIETWGNIETWDHNQYGALLTAYVGEIEEHHLMEGFWCNGGIYDLLK